MGTLKRLWSIIAFVSVIFGLTAACMLVPVFWVATGDPDPLGLVGRLLGVFDEL